jgi:hypothetical protein
MTGTICVLTSHSLSRSYLNHLELLLMRLNITLYLHCVFFLQLSSYSLGYIPLHFTYCMYKLHLTTRRIFLQANWT